MPSELKVGDQVYIRNQRTSKFQPIFGPSVFTVIDIANGGAIVRNNTDHTTYTRHVDDLKLAPSTPQASEITWFPPNEAVTVDLPLGEDGPVPAEVPAEVAVPQRRSGRTSRPPPYLQEYVLT